MCEQNTQSYFDRPPLIKRPRKSVVHRGPTEAEARARRLQELGLSPQAQPEGPPQRPPEGTT